jgi:hypothetical protein
MAESEKKKVLVLRRSNGKLQPALQPIVLEYRERKKRTRIAGENTEPRYTEGLEDVQRTEGDVMRVAQRSARALSKSLDTYEQERKRSAKEKRDGAIEDFPHNSAKAVSTYMKEMSEVPMDIADSLDTPSYRKRLRDSLRQTSRVIRLFRI